MKRSLVTDEDTKLYSCLLELIEKDIKPDLAVAALNWLDSWEHCVPLEIVKQDHLLAYIKNEINW